MIIRLTHPLLIPKLVDMAKVVPGAPIEHMADVLIEAVYDEKGSRIFVDEKDGVVKGFIYGSLEHWQGEPVVYVQLCVVLPTERYSCHELLARIEAWARENKIKHIIFVTMRNWKAYARKYHFAFDGTVLKRSVKNE